MPKKLSQEEFIEKANIVHNNQYSYSLVDYKNSQTNVKIFCKKHGVFEQTPGNHLTGSKCPKCKGEKQSIKNVLGLDTFINRSNIVHQNKYDYSKAVYINTGSKIEIVCAIHGSFWQTAGSHMYGVGCPKCNSSKKEDSIANYLSNKDAFFTREYRFSDCRSKNPLPFDFAVFEDEQKTKLKCLIEYDGEQHFKIVNRFKMTNKTLLNNKYRDKIKTDYCLKNNIVLIRVPYWEFKNIETILSQILTFR